jgi:CRP/FNR family nitrogen fixation transcriptional regulator
VVVSGAVRTYKLLSDGRRQIDAFHLPGDIFGIEAGSEHRFSAEAIQEVTVRAIRRRSLDVLAQLSRQVVCFRAIDRPVNVPACAKDGANLRP